MSLPEQLCKAVFDGLQRLWAIRLPGSPAGDTLPGVANIWVDALGDAPITWNVERDLPRIQRSFRRMELVCEKWPSPSFFMSCMPPVPETLKLTPPKNYSVQKEWKELVAKMKRLNA